MGRAILLLPISVGWAVACFAVGAMFLRRPPAVGLASFESVLGAVIGFLVGNADGPAEVPAYTAVGASLGLFAIGLVALLITTARSSAGSLRRTAMVVLVTAVPAAAALTILLRLACPL